MRIFTFSFRYGFSSKKSVQTQLNRFHWRRSQTLISATITDFTILGVIVRILHFHSIWILLKNQPDTSQTIPFGEVTKPISATSWSAYWELQWDFMFSMQIWILLRNQSRYKLNHLNGGGQIWTPGPLLFSFSSPIWKVSSLGTIRFGISSRKTPGDTVSSILSWF